MGTGYYEHHIEVQFTEGLLSSSNDWQWFIDYTEANFAPTTELVDFNDFIRMFSTVQLAYSHLAKIVDLIGDFHPIFSTYWLNGVYSCVLIRSGVKQLEEGIGISNFFDVLSIASYGTRLLNSVSETRYSFNAQLLYNSNLHQLYEFEPLGNERQRLVNIAESLDIQGFNEAAQTLKSNFEGNLVSVDGQYVEELMDACFDANFFSFKSAKRRAFQTWQEALLCDSFGFSFDNGALEPMIRMSDGSESPDSSFWSKNVLLLAKNAFIDKRAVCVIEVLDYCMHEQTPTEESQDLLVELFLNHAEQCISKNEPIRKLRCTAMKVIESLRDAKQFLAGPREKFYKGLNCLLSNKTDYDVICFMKDHSLPCNKMQNEIYLLKTKNITKDAIASVSNAYELLAVFKDSRCAKNCDFDDAQRLLELFREIVQEAGFMAAELFYWAMMFYIDILDNSQVDNMWTKKTLIALRHIWQEKYYSVVIGSMQTISHEEMISAEEVERFNKDFLESPYDLAKSVFLQSDDAIAEALESMTEQAIVYIFDKTSISEYYPVHTHVAYRQDNHSIDYMVATEIMRVYKKKSYRFLNSLNEQEILDGFFNNLGQTIQIVTAFINIKPAYEWIVEHAPEHYVLLSYPDLQPTLGHLTQLFPLLENVIREIGELFSIVPFQAEKSSFTLLKDVVSVLVGIIKEVRDITGTIQGCNEFLFVHHIMYSINGFNIRNDCVHGRRYQDSVGVAYAFRLTVICTYMMLKRLRELELTIARLENYAGEQ